MRPESHIFKAFGLLCFFEEHIFQAQKISAFQSIKVDELNQRENLWRFLGAVLNCFFHQSNFAQIWETQNSLMNAYFVIKNIFAEVSRLDFAKRFALQVFEIYLNFCNLVVYFQNFEKSRGTKILNFNAPSSVKSLFLEIERFMPMLFEQMPPHLDPPTKDLKIRVWKGLKSFHYNHILDSFNLNRDNILRNKMLQELLVIKEFFIHISQFVEAKMIEQLIQVYTGIERLAKHTRSLIDTKCSIADHLSYTNAHKRSFDSRVIRNTIDDLSKCRNPSEVTDADFGVYQKPTRVECATCKRNTSGLFVFCHHCYHCFHASHLNDMLRNSNYLCEVCFKCECLKPQTVIHFSKNLNLFKIA